MQHKRLSKLPQHSTAAMPEYLVNPNEHFEANTLNPPFWVISDTHWLHKNIIGYSNRPWDHNEIMVERWNWVIEPDTPILHLGDLFLWPTNYRKFQRDIAPRLNGDKYLILGNHDDAEVIDFETVGFKVIKPFRIKYKGFTVEFSHYPSEGMLPGYLRVHGHIHNSGYGGKLEPKRMTQKGNVNVSVEVIDYTPQPITDVLDKALNLGAESGFDIEK